MNFISKHHFYFAVVFLFGITILVGIIMFSETVSTALDIDGWNSYVPEQKACTQEAKHCPDGSAVGRTGPNCEFALCPSVASCEGRECPGAGVVNNFEDCVNAGGFVAGGVIPSFCVMSDGKRFFENTTIPAIASGSLTGKVSIGPICPVERIPPDPGCTPSPEAYVSREFLVLSSDQKQTITSFHADANGSYSVSLPSGVYVVVSAKTGMGYMSKDLPSTITIQAGKTVTLNIDVDTGIR